MARTALLFSGGMDSTALAYWKKPDVGIFVDYGQKSAAGEYRAARKIAELLEIDLEPIRIDCSSLGSGDLAGSEPSHLAPESEWWPFRNQLLVTLGVMRCVSIRVETLLVGSIKSDAFHADGTPEFYSNMDLAVSSQEGSIRIKAPALEYTASELISLSGIPGGILGWTHSCHKASRACGYCRGCNKAQQVFRTFSSQ